MIFAGLVALIPAGIIAVLAISKKTSQTVRRVSIIALALIGLAFVTCTILLLIFGSFAAEEKVRGYFPIDPVKETKQDIVTMVIVSVVVIIILTLVILLSIREIRAQKRKHHS